MFSGFCDEFQYLIFFIGCFGFIPQITSGNPELSAAPVRAGDHGCL